MERERRTPTPVAVPHTAPDDQAPNNYPWRSVYVERSELDDLMDCWKKVADFERPEDIEPQLVVIVGESGFGKTRLVHKFYETLAERHQQAHGTQYWPPTIGRTNDALAAHPEKLPDFSQESLYLWWGIKLTAQTSPVIPCEPVLSEASLKLIPHLAPIYYAKRKKQISQDMGLLALEYNPFKIFTEVAFAQQALTTLYDIWKTKPWKVPPSEDIAANTERTKRSELHDIIFNDLSVLMNPDNTVTRTIPMVLFIDDAQWIHCDPGLSSLLLDLMRSAKANHWPLMILVTHWQAEWGRLWDEQSGLPGMLRSADASLQYHGWDEWRLRHKDDQPPGYIPLGYKFDLSSVLKAALPGVYNNTEQRNRLIGEFRSDGRQIKPGIVENPRHLDELLRTLYRDKRYLIDKDLNSALIDDWEIEFKKLFGTFEYISLLRKRFDTLPDYYRETLRWAAFQGIEFSELLTEAIALQNETSFDLPWDALTRHESLIIREANQFGGLSHFALSEYQSTAARSMLQEGDALLTEQYRTLLCDWLQFGDFYPGVVFRTNQSEERLLSELAINFLHNWQDEAAEAYTFIAHCLLVKLHWDTGSYTTAFEHAQQLLPLINSRWDVNDRLFGSLIETITAFSQFGYLSEAITYTEIVLKRLDGSKCSTRRNKSIQLLTRLGHFYTETNLEEAEKKYRLCIDIANADYKERPTIETARTLSVAYNSLALLFKKQQNAKDYPEAYGLLGKSRIIRRRLYANQQNQASLLDLAVVYQIIGDIARLQYKRLRTLAYHKRCLTLRKRAYLMNTSSQDALVSLAISYDRLSNISFRYFCDPDTALCCQDQHVKFAEELFQAYPTPDNQDKIVHAYSSLGRLHFETNQLRAANRDFNKALENLNGLPTGIEHPSYLRRKCYILTELGKIYLKTNTKATECEELSESITLAEELYNVHPNTANAHVLIDAYLARGEFLSDPARPPISIHKLLDDFNMVILIGQTRAIEQGDIEAWGKVCNVHNLLLALIEENRISQGQRTIILEKARQFMANSPSNYLENALPPYMEVSRNQLRQLISSLCISTKYSLLLSVISNGRVLSRQTIIHQTSIKTR